jgi:hypothetical protein
MRSCRLFFACLIFALGLGGCASASAAGHVRTYYIAADEVNWNYCPAGTNVMMGRPFNTYERAFTVRTPHRIGCVYRKVFRNNASRPYSIHPHGVLYAKDSEGNAYNDGTAGASKIGGAVPPGHTYTYTWQVPERAGPGPDDPSSVVWLYHSHVDDQRDVDAGLVGTIIVTARGMSKPDGTPNEGRYSLLGTAFADSNLKFAINGYLYANGPKMVMKREERMPGQSRHLAFPLPRGGPYAWRYDCVLSGAAVTYARYPHARTSL